MSREFLPSTGSGAIICEPSTRPEAVEAEAVEAEAVVVFMSEGGAGTGSAAELDAATGGLIGRLAAAGELTGRRYECVPLLATPGLRAGQLVVVGIGKREDVTAGVLYRAAATAARQLAGRPRSPGVASRGTHS